MAIDRKIRSAKNRNLRSSKLVLDIFTFLLGPTQEIPSAVLSWPSNGGHGSERSFAQSEETGDDNCYSLLVCSHPG